MTDKTAPSRLAEPALKPGRGRTYPKTIKILLSLILISGILGLIGVFFWFFNDSGKQTDALPSAPGPVISPLVYKAPYDQELKRIEAAVLNGLEKAGVSQAQCKLWLDLNDDGESARWEINLLPEQDLASIAAGLDLALAQTLTQGRWQRQRNFWHLEIFFNHRLSHQVNLRQKGQTPLNAAPRPDAVSSPPTEVPGAVPPAAPPPTTPIKPKVAIIVDDVGLNKEALIQLLATKLPLTFSVLPYAPDAPEVARLIRSQNRELWLHLPMEPLGGHNPGPGALYSNMDKSQLMDLTEKALQRVPGAVGVNNHMGSRFTLNPKALAGPLQVIQAKGLMFIDSLTSPQSVAWREATALGITSGRRDIFLDHKIDEKAIIAQIEKLVGLARRQGSAIAICHPHAATIKALLRTKNYLLAEVDLAPASALLDGD
jgi:polysaccharide deacetylase 2 family uncharacterized protein YibQ